MLIDLKKWTVVGESCGLPNSLVWNVCNENTPYTNQGKGAM